MAIGKPDATGRSSGQLSGRARKMRSPPKGEPWVWMTRELLASSTIASLSKTGRRLLDFLLIEHMNHAGTENGDLIATKEQLINFGMSRRLIPEAIREVEFAGLIRVQRGVACGGVKSPNFYRLTFLRTRTFHRPPTSGRGSRKRPSISGRKNGRAKRRHPSGKI